MWNVGLKIAVEQCRRAGFVRGIMRASALAFRWTGRSIDARVIARFIRRLTDSARSMGATDPIAVGDFAISIIAGIAQACRLTSDGVVSRVARRIVSGKRGAATDSAKSTVIVQSGIFLWTRCLAINCPWERSSRKAAATCKSKLRAVGNFITALSWSSVWAANFSLTKPSTTSTATAPTIVPTISNCGARANRTGSVSPTNSLGREKSSHATLD